MKKFRWFLRAAIIVVGLTAIALRLWIYFHRPAEIRPEFGRVDDFSLTDQTGKLVTRDSLKGRTWVASFIFTRCMGPCPLITSKASQLQKEFTSPKFRLVSFTVDPTFDTPPVLAHYAEGYNADPSRWFFLTGDKSNVFSLIRRCFHLAIENDNPNDPNAILHSTMFVLVDPEENILGFYNATDPDAISRLRSDLHHQLSA